MMLKWTSDPPTQSGAYWWRPCRNAPCKLVVIEKKEPFFRCQLVFPASETSAIEYADTMGGEWQKATFKRCGYEMD